MRLYSILAILTVSATAMPAIAGPVSTPNLAGGLGTMLAPPSAPVITGGGPAPAVGGAPAPGGSAYVSGFVSAYTGSGATSGPNQTGTTTSE